MRWIAIALSILTGFVGSCRASDESRALAQGAGEPSTTANKTEGLPLGLPIFVRIFKEEKELELWVERKGRFELLSTYDICTWSGDLGPKLAEGDGQSPEGFYFVPPEMMNPNSDYHLAFNVGFPNAYDKAHGRTGSYIMVHGSCVSIGCFAMTDKRIEAIYAMADAAHKAGQRYFRVHIFPFRMTAAKMKEHEGSRWVDFWTNLKEGYDWFEDKGRPPEVTVEGLRYRFK